jgi:hypothetical protein
MPSSVHITTPIEPLETRIKELRIPKARQKQLRAMMDEARARMAREEQARSEAQIVPEEKLQNASAAD